MQMKHDKLDRIDLDDEATIGRWMDHFGVTVDQLREAVLAVGNHPDDVAEHLLNQGGSAGPG